MTKLRVMISGGGTGGHIFPAIAIAEALKREWKDHVQFLFIGAKGGMEMERVPKAGYPIEGLWISGFQRRLSRRNLLFPVKLITSLVKAGRAIKRFQPHLVIGTGGYASGPLLYMASRKGIPTLIQEQNAMPGITNRLLGKRVDKICVAFEGMERFFPKEKIVITGNPVRENLAGNTMNVAEARKAFGLDPEKKTLLVIGGSLGARTINESIGMGLEELLQNDIQVIWQTGKKWSQQAENNVRELNTAQIKPCTFIHRMDLAYKAADLVVSRAGAIAVSELALLNKAVIFVPSPNVTGDHQTKNAMALVKRDAASIVSDEEAMDHLVHHIVELMKDPEKRKKMETSMNDLKKEDASGTLAKTALELMEPETIE